MIFTLPFLQDSSPQIVFLGTGTPRQDPERSGPATALVVGGKCYLVDCGPGVVRRIAAAQRLGKTALAQKNLTRVFITHLHSDHTLGYPDLIFSPWVVGRTEPLEAYGPKGLGKMTRALESAYSEDVDVRTEGLEHGNKTGYRVHVHEIGPGPIYDDGRVKVEAFLVKHGSWKYAFGYAFHIGAQTVVFSGDTSPSPELEKAALGADVLIHEVYALDEMGAENRSGGDDWPTYLHAFHTSTVELGQIAVRCQPKVLVLTHVLRRKADDDELVSEVRQGGFLGKVIVAKDLDAITP